MKILSKILFFLTLSLTSVAQDTVDYHAMIQPVIIGWKNECIAQLSTQEIITITDVLLLSYQVVQASITIHQARLTIQEELLNIVTLSINDSFDVSMQAQNNDLTAIKNAVIAIEQAQEKMKFACNALINFGPLVINIDPASIQFFISNLKTFILNWAKNQQNTMTKLGKIKREIVTTMDLFTDVKNIFNTIVTNDPIEHGQLLQGANSLTDMYKKTENMIASITEIRQESLASFNTLLTLYFKCHYQVLYDCLQNSNNVDLFLMATPDHTLPHPEDIFALA